LPTIVIDHRRKFFINHFLAIDMIQSFYYVVPLIVGISTLLLGNSVCRTLSSGPLFLNEAIAQQDTRTLISGSQESGPDGQQGQVPDIRGSTEQCPPNQHNIGSTNQCEWDNCGSATPPMYRNTQTGRCVFDCSEVGQFWVKQDNICVLGEAGNATSTQSPPTVSSASTQVNSSGNSTIQDKAKGELTSENATLRTSSSNDTSLLSNLTQAVATLVGEPALPYACFSNTFTCYCDGTQDCKKLASSNECKAEVRSVEGKPGLGNCDWNANS
jgi:hypothetical protein